jgi:hypothetical protein
LQPDRRTVWLYLSEAAREFTLDKLQRLGFNGDFSRPDFGDEMKSGIEVVCEHDTFDGKLREKWQLKGGGQIEHTAPCADIIRKLNAMYAARNRQPKATPASVTPERTD